MWPLYGEADHCAANGERALRNCQHPRHRCRVPPATPPSGLPEGSRPLPATHVAASGQKPPSAILESMAGMLALVHTMAA